MQERLEHIQAPLRGPLICRQHMGQATVLCLEHTLATLRDRQALSSLMMAALLCDSFLAASDRQKVSRLGRPSSTACFPLSTEHRPLDIWRVAIYSRSLASRDSFELRLIV